jgi:lysophospholipase L1-like esterase
LVFFLSISIIAKSEIKSNPEHSKLIAPKSTEYQWYYNGAKLDGATNREIILVSDGLYEVDIVNEEGIKTRQKAIVAGGTVRNIYVIGDSTASLYAANVYPRTGWAQVFQYFFNKDSIVVVDKALSGRSSKSFYTDVNGWPVVKPLLKSGDFLFIQFAHNDEKTDTALHTDPSTTFKQYLQRYINEARAKGAIPVLLTAICRNYWAGDTITVTYSHSTYPAAMKELAKSLNVPIIDMEEGTRQLMMAMGKYYTTWKIYNNLTAGQYANYPTGNSDNTHLQETGAREYAKILADSIWTTKYDTLKLFLKPHLKGDSNTVKYSVTPAKSGWVLGALKIPSVKTLKLNANSAPGYNFEGWFENSVLVSASAELSVSGSTKRNLVATFNSVISGINESASKISIFRNNSAIDINCDTRIKSVCVYNLMGKIVFSAYTKDNQFKIPAKTIHPGIYIIKVVLENNKLVEKKISVIN